MRSTFSWLLLLVCLFSFYVIAICYVVAALALKGAVVVVGGVAMAMSVASMAHWAHNKTLLDLSSIQADLQ